MIANMLSGLTQEGEAIRHKVESTPKAMFLGDGFLPIPEKLTERICRCEYIDMSDLLPEFWLDQKAEEGTAKRANRSTAKKRVQDINVLLQCYAVHIGVMATKFPNMVSELMVYMINILRESQEYQGLAWATYDAAYRKTMQVSQLQVTARLPDERGQPPSTRISFPSKTSGSSSRFGAGPHT